MNDSATLAASLQIGRDTQLTLNLSTEYGSCVWLAEPRHNGEPGSLNIQAGETFAVAGLSGRFIAPHPELKRLWFVRFSEDIKPYSSALR